MVHPVVVVIAMNIAAVLAVGVGDKIAVGELVAMVEVVLVVPVAGSG